MTRFWVRRTEGRSDGVTALLDMLSPSATQVKTMEIISGLFFLYFKLKSKESKIRGS